MTRRRRVGPSGGPGRIRSDLQDPATVAAELTAAGQALAGRWERVGAGDLQRRGRRSDGAAFTVDSFARDLLHDPVHHLVDVVQGNEALRSR